MKYPSSETERGGRERGREREGERERDVDLRPSRNSSQHPPEDWILVTTPISHQDEFNYDDLLRKMIIRFMSVLFNQLTFI